MADTETAKAPCRKGGRPTRDAADRLTAHVVSCAASLFTHFGYAGTSVEAIAAAAQVGKNTIYRRFATKAELFEAVVDQLMGKVLPPPGEVAAEQDVTDALRRLGISLVEAALNPETTALQRLIIAEAERFPEIAGICIERAYKPAVARARAILTGAFPPTATAGALDFAAQQFVASLAYRPHLYALLGRREFSSPDEIAGYVDRALAIFSAGLNCGAR
jgi:AcrR family transcriptional regulator